MSKFRNAGGYQRTRIDTRPASPEKAAGIRGIHRDTDGTVIGGVTRDGTPLGSKARQGPADGSSLGNPVTVGLDRQAEMNAPGAAPRESFAATEARKRAAMKPAAPAAPRAGSDPAWKRIAAGQPITPKPMSLASSRPTMAPAPPKAMAPTGKALAQRNIASMGTAGAIADYQKRSGEQAMAARQKQRAHAEATAERITKRVESEKSEAFKKDFSAASQSVKAINTSPLKGVPGSRLFGMKGQGGLPVAEASKPVTAQNFTVPPVANPQSVGASQPKPTQEPAAAWEKPNGVSWENSPKTQNAPQATKREPSWKQSTGINVKFQQDEAAGFAQRQAASNQAAAAAKQQIAAPIEARRDAKVQAINAAPTVSAGVFKGSMAEKAVQGAQNATKGFRATLAKQQAQRDVQEAVRKKQQKTGSTWGNSFGRS